MNLASISLSWRIVWHILRSMAGGKLMPDSKQVAQSPAASLERRYGSPWSTMTLYRDSCTFTTNRSIYGSKSSTGISWTSGSASKISRSEWIAWAMQASIVIELCVFMNPTSIAKIGSFFKGPFKPSFSSPQRKRLITALSVAGPPSGPSRRGKRCNLYARRSRCTERFRFEDTSRSFSNWGTTMLRWNIRMPGMSVASHIVAPAGCFSGRMES